MNVYRSLMKYIQHLVASFLLRKKELFSYFLIGSILFVCIGIVGNIWFAKEFLVWWCLPIMMLIIPFALQILEDKASLFGQFATHSRGSLHFLLCSVLSGGMIYRSGDVTLGLIIGISLFWSLVYGLSGRIYFWVGLLLLGSIMGALLFNEPMFAEELSVFLYYSLCVGVLCDLVDGRINARFSSDFFSRLLNVFECIGSSLPRGAVRARQEYGKEMLLILYVAVCFVLFSIGVWELSPQMLFGVSLAAFVQVGWLLGREDWQRVWAGLKGLLYILYVVVFLLWGMSFLWPISVDFRPIFTYVLAILLLVDFFWGKRSFVWRYSDFSYGRLNYSGFVAVLIMMIGLVGVYLYDRRLGVVLWSVGVLFCAMVALPQTNLWKRFLDLFE